jgi:hypothetical protein
MGVPGVLLVAVRVHPRRRCDDVTRLSDDAAAVSAVVGTGGAFIGAHLAGAVLVGIACAVFFAGLAVFVFVVSGAVVVGLVCRDAAFLGLAFSGLALIDLAFLGFVFTGGGIR